MWSFVIGVLISVIVISLIFACFSGKVNQIYDYAKDEDSTHRLFGGNFRVPYEREFGNLDDLLVDVKGKYQLGMSYMKDYNGIEVYYAMPMIGYNDFVTVMKYVDGTYNLHVWYNVAQDGSLLQWSNYEQAGVYDYLMKKRDSNNHLIKNYGLRENLMQPERTLNDMFKDAEK